MFLDQDNCFISFLRTIFMAFVFLISPLIPLAPSKNKETGLKITGSGGVKLISLEQKSTGTNISFNH